MFTGEVIWGGVGSGLYGMFFYIIIAVFIAGLMVGRTPEYLGKKIEAREIKLAAVGALFVPTMVLILTAIAIVTDRGLASIYNHDLPAHGFSEALYAYDSQSNNNGSAFAGYGATEFSTLLGSLALWMGRFAPLIAALALGGALAAKKSRAAVGRNVPHRRRNLRGPAGRRRDPDRRPDDLPRAHAGADRGGALAMIARTFVRSIVAVVVLTVVFGLIYPIVFTGFAQLAFADKANGSLVERDGKVVGSKLAAQAFTKPAVLPPPPLGDRAGVQRGRDDLREPRPDQPRSGKGRPSAGARRS